MLMETRTHFMENSGPMQQNGLAFGIVVMHAQMLGINLRG
jgi:hypothetical protein